MKLIRVLAVLLLVAGVAGCASTPPPVDPNDESLSLVYGYFDMSDAPSKLEWVSLKKYGSTKKGGEWYGMAVREGVFLHIGISPGSYQVDSFGGMGGIPVLSSRQFEYDFGGKGRNTTAIRIQSPGAYFLGSHKFEDHSGGLFKPDMFDMKPVNTPGEREVLERVIAAMESEDDLKPYTRQLAMAKQRLASLR